MLPSLGQLSLENIAAPSGRASAGGPPKATIKKPKRLNLDELINKTKEVVRQAAKANEDKKVLGDYDQDGPQPLIKELQPKDRDNTGRYLCPVLSCGNGLQKDGKFYSTVETNSDGQAVCNKCGYVLGMNISEDTTARRLADEDFQQRQAKEHAGATSEEEVRFNTITEEEGGWVVYNPISGKGETYMDFVALKNANVRFYQIREWVEYFSEEYLRSQLRFWLQPFEIRTVKRLARIACKQWAREGGTGENNGSPIIWTIILVREMVARRSSDFTVINSSVQEFLSMEEMHNYLYQFKGDNMRITKNAASTLAGRQWRALTERTTEEVAQRKMAYHELGSIFAQKRKGQRLNDLIREGSNKHERLNINVVTMEDFNVEGQQKYIAIGV